MSLKAPSDPVVHWLDAPTIRRLLLSLISQEQANLQRRGLIRQDQALAALTFGRPVPEVDALAIDEATLGFDSLSRLELISHVNRFFQLNQTGAEDYLLISPAIGRWIEVITHHQELAGARLSFGFATSGTAGPAQTHVHAIDALATEVNALCEGPLAHISPKTRVLSLVPPHHIYGFLFTCLLPRHLGAEVVDLHRHAPSAAAREGRAGDLIIGTPFSWKLLAHAGVALPDGMEGVTSAGPSTADTWQQDGPGRPDRMTEIYGATETGGLGSRTAFATPFDLLPHLLPLAEGIARASAPETPLPVQDLIRWHGSRQFVLEGRLDHVVQVAGVNVSPSLVAREIAAVEGVAEAAVRLDGERLKAFVVPQPGTPDQPGLEKRIQAHLVAHLAAPARPGAICFGAALPRNEMGKLSDWSVSAPPAADEAAEKPDEPFLIN